MLGIIINNKLRFQSEFIRLNKLEGIIGFEDVRGLKDATDEQWVSWGFKEVINIVPLDSEKLGDWYETETEIKRQLIAKTSLELEQDIIDLEEFAKNEQQFKKLKIANTKIVEQIEAILSDSLQTSDEEVINNIDFYDYWDKSGVQYNINKIVKTFNGQLYRCVQAHTSQVGWNPELVPALFTPIVLPGTIGDWVQPTGAQDAYNIGDQVIFEGATYESLIDANTWSPSTYPAGWQLIN